MTTSQCGSAWLRVIHIRELIESGFVPTTLTELIQRFE